METTTFIAKMILVALLVVSFALLGCWSLKASWQLMSNTQSLVEETESIGITVESAIRLQIEAYGVVVKDVLSPLLSAIVAGFIAYVVGKTIGTTSYNRVEAKKLENANPKRLELL